MIPPQAGSSAAREGATPREGAIAGEDAARVATVADALRAVAPALSPLLVSAGALGRLLAAGQLPLTTGGGFECHLGDPDRVDLAVRFTAGDGRAALARGEAAPAFRGATREARGWAQIRALARRWALPGSAAHRHLENLWLELDLDASAPAAPGVFFDLGDAPLAAWLELGELLRARPLGEGARRRLAEGRAALPRGASLRYLGVMLGRGGDGVRFTAYGLAPDAVAPYLRTVGWPGDPAALDAALHVARAACGPLVLHVDLGEEVGPTAGLELRPGEGGWPELLARAGSLWVGDPALARALLAWPGTSSAAGAGAAWPRALRGRSARIARRLNHLKVAAGEGGPARVKAYLYQGLLEA